MNTENQNPRSAVAFLKALASLALISLLAACAATPPLQWPEPLVEGKPTERQPSVSLGGAQAVNTRVHRAPKVPEKPASSVEKAKLEGGDLALSVEQMPLPDFIQYVLGDLLELNFELTEAVAKRKELVTLRSSQAVTRENLLASLQAVLRTYGLSLVQDGELLRVLPQNRRNEFTPRFLRGQSLPGTPEDLRPVFQYVELHSGSGNIIERTVNDFFQGRVRVVNDIANNALVLFGLRPDVEMVLDAIHLLDQPLLRGQHGRRVELVFVDADPLSRKLRQILEAEGYTVALGRGSPGALALVPIPESNSLVLLAADLKLLEHAVEWVRQLDTPGQRPGAKGLFAYNVEHTDAQSLAQTLRELFPRGGAGGEGGGAGNRLIVNPTTNSLIFRGEAGEFQEVRRLLLELDRPARQVLIEVVIAELTLDNSESLGVEWGLAEAGLGDYVLQGGTSGLGLAGSGLRFTLLTQSGDTRALLNFLAEDKRGRILSTPRIIARSGKQASISVGNDVPVITSQQTSAATGSDSILQSVEYRSTGIILKVTPVIHGAGQVDLDIQQETSSAFATVTGVSSSPTIKQRAISTQLTVPNGATVVLGGLRENSRNQDETGVPFLKDLPGIGAAFRNRANSVSQTELLVLITAHTLTDRSELEAVTSALRRKIDPLSTKLLDTMGGR